MEIDPKIPESYNKFRDEPCSVANDIKKDVERTFQQLPFFQNPQGREMLTNVLVAYANFDKEIGYVQGMNSLTGQLLWNSVPPDKSEIFDCWFYLEDGITCEDLERNAFGFFCHIMKTKNWRSIYLDRPGHMLAEEAMKQLESELNARCPEVMDHILKHVCLFTFGGI